MATNTTLPENGIFPVGTGKIFQQILLNFFDNDAMKPFSD